MILQFCFLWLLVHLTQAPEVETALRDATLAHKHSRFFPSLNLAGFQRWLMRNGEDQRHSVHLESLPMIFWVWDVQSDSFPVRDSRPRSFTKDGLWRHVDCSSSECDRYGVLKISGFQLVHSNPLTSGSYAARVTMPPSLSNGTSLSQRSP